MDKHHRKHAVPEGVELMLTKVSEEELEHGLAIATPPPHEARSRSGGSWGSSNPENSVAEAARTRPCSPRKPATAPSAPGADMAGFGAHARPGQARGRSARTAAAI